MLSCFGGDIIEYSIEKMMRRERPRERLKNQGKQSLKNDELIAILLRTGFENRSVLKLSQDVLMQLEEVEDLAKIEVEELMQIKGIKLAKAATIVAALELGRRLCFPTKELTKIKNIRDVYHLLFPTLSNQEQEHFIVIYLNSKSEILKYETVFIGTLNQTVVHPREIFKMAIKLNSAAVVLVHNHPSGDSTPSNADIKVTKHLLKVADIIGIEIMDHIVIGAGELYSILNASKHFI